MFQFFKRKKTLVKQPTLQAVDDVLLALMVCDTPLYEFVHDKQLSGDVLELTLQVDNTVARDDLEGIHRKLQSQCAKFGIMEVNLTVGVRDVKATPKIHHPTSQQNNDTQMKTTKTTPAQHQITPHPRIRHIVAVASGKGGVGKSTTAVNIALALKKLGNRVGVLDADIYGPSVPDMLGVAGVRPAVENDEFIPIDVAGIAMMSIGSLLDNDSTPVAWRGIKATGALMQLYQQTAWPNLDYLVIDMPPGTGDIQLTLAQRIPVTGAIIVTTPQHIALLDAKKGVEMFGKTHIPVIGIVENMALHTCSHCGHTEAIFGHGGADGMVAQYGVPLLGRLPLASTIREHVDKGTPSVLCEDEFADYYLKIANALQIHIGQFAKAHDDKRIF